MSRVYISVELRQIVTRRANGRCEYCLLHQDDTPFSHQIDHFIALKHGGQTVSENLVLACLECNRYKGSDLTALDPLTHEITPIFNPRAQVWKEHFMFQNLRIAGQTATGRATASLLRFNTRERLVQRQVLRRVGRYDTA
jgi:hypothetical protein